MTITVGGTETASGNGIYADPDESQFLQGNPINKGQESSIAIGGFLQMIRVQNGQYGRRGSRLGGIIFAPAPWESNQNSTLTYESSNSNTLSQLYNFFPGLKLLRYVENSGNIRYRFTTRFYSANLRLDIDFYNLDTGALVAGTFFNNTSLTPEWNEATYEFFEAGAHEGNNTSNPKRQIGVRFQARRSTASGTGQLFQIQCYEQILTDSTYMPTIAP